MSTRADANPHRLRRGAVIAAFLAVAWGLTGCTSSGSDSGGSEADMAPGEGVGAEVGGDEGAADGGGFTEDRSVIVTGAMYMTVEDPIAAANEATVIVVDAGGRVDARTETAPSEYDGGAARLTLRIPADDLDAVVDDLRDLGDVDELSTSAADVTREVTDLEARISTLRASTARIQGLLAEAEKVADIITIENELDRRQSELESLEARQRGLDDQVSMSTLDLSLTTEPVVIVDGSPRTFLGGLESGWDALVSFVTGALVVTGVLVPWIAAAALVAALVLVAVRAVKTRRPRAARSEPAAADQSEAHRDAEQAG